MKRARYLIIGGSGLIGSHLRLALGHDRAIATYKSRPISDGIYFDPATMTLADAILRDSPGLTHAFVLFAMSNIDACAIDAERAFTVNVESQKRIIDELIGAGIVPVYASSDAVFDGTRGMWNEDDNVNPVLTYGRHKVQIEKYLTENSNSAQILRLSKVVCTLPGVDNLLNEWMQAMEQGNKINCAYDQIFSPSDVDDVVIAMRELVKNNNSGVFHVCGPQPISRFDFALTLESKVRRYRTVSSQIVACSIRDVSVVEPRPCNVSMSPRKLYAAIGREFKDIGEICQIAAARRYGSGGLRRSGPAPGDG